MVKEIHYVKNTHVHLVQTKGDTAASSGSHELLLGARLHIDPTSLDNGWLSANKVPDVHGNIRTGFVEAAHLSTNQQLKIFYLDVGQGDATLIEAEGAIIIIDGGPNKGFHEELIKRLERLQAADLDANLQPKTQLHINAVIITHFDKDHFYGLIKVLEDNRFSIGKLYHNGLPRYGEPAGKDLDLGDIVIHNDGSRSISTDFRGIQSARDLLASNDLLTGNGNDNLFARFLRAVVQAFDSGRLGGCGTHIQAGRGCECGADSGHRSGFAVRGSGTGHYETIGFGSSSGFSEPPRRNCHQSKPFPIHIPHH